MALLINQLNKKQKEAFDLMATGKNIFLSGVAGAGKSHLIKVFFNIYCKERVIGVTSTTGTSALLIKGTTMHSYLGIGLGQGSALTLLSNVKKNNRAFERWKKLNTLIIDEVSMLPFDLFDKLDYIARSIRNPNLPFGGISLILCGDLLQLPPINTDGYFCFHAKSWHKCIEYYIVLEESMRQQDPVFQDCLLDVRNGVISPQTKKILEARIGVPLLNDYGILPTRLFALNRSVDEINEQELDKLAEDGAEFYEYDMVVSYFKSLPIKVIENFKKNCIAAEKLSLCIGAQVMLIKNLDLERGLANGSRGVVTSFVAGIPKVKFLNGEEEIVDYNSWDLMDDDIIVASIKQISLKVSYALTIHKSQGCTLDLVEVDLSDMFGYSQAYVALSRVTELKGLSIVSIDWEKIKPSPYAKEFYDKIAKNTEDNKNKDFIPAVQEVEKRL